MASLRIKIIHRWIMNGGATEIGSVSASRVTGASGDVGAFPAIGGEALLAGDTVEVWVRNLNAAADCTFSELSLFVEKK